MCQFITFVSCYRTDVLWTFVKTVENVGFFPTRQSLLFSWVAYCRNSDSDIFIAATVQWKFVIRNFNVLSAAYWKVGIEGYKVIAHFVSTINRAFVSNYIWTDKLDSNLVHFSLKMWRLVAIILMISPDSQLTKFRIYWLAPDFYPLKSLWNIALCSP